MSELSKSLERIPLAAAATIVFARVRGMQTVDPHSPEMAASLNTVARALASLAKIYAGEPLETAKELGPSELLGGAFDGGAQIFRAGDGRQFYPLGIERGEVLAAIGVLRAAKIRF